MDRPFNDFSPAVLATVSGCVIYYINKGGRLNFWQGGLAKGRAGQPSPAAGILGVENMLQPIMKIMVMLIMVMMLNISRKEYSGK